MNEELVTPKCEEDFRIYHGHNKMLNYTRNIPKVTDCIVMFNYSEINFSLVSLLT
jgi:hypothetical protein